MAYLEFNDSLMVENKLIDQEHAILIEYINLLQKAVENESSVKIVGQVLDGLTEYTKTHFFVEEEMMRPLSILMSISIKPRMKDLRVNWQI